jgi:hypothetical protein
VQRVDAPVTVSFSYAEQLLNVRMRIWENGDFSVVGLLVHTHHSSFKT